MLIRGGTIYDGSGSAPYVGDVALQGDRIVYVGPHAPGRAARTVDAAGKAVSPGFINMLSWANESLIADGRGMSDTAQGVTLEVMGEGSSMGPWNPAMKRLELQRQGDIKFPIRWTTLGQYLEYMQHKGITPNVASFVGAAAEIYHYKQAGTENWGKIDAAIAKVDQARASGLRITADMYTYPASSTGLDAAFPLWIQDGGVEKWVARLKDPKLRARAIADMHKPDASENTKLVLHDPDKVLLVSFKTARLKPLTGKTLAEVAKMRGKSPEETAADLVAEDGTRIGVVYFSMNEDNVRRETALPWMSFGSDADSEAPEGVFLKSSTHPRAYGNVARLLGKYVRDEKTTSLQDAVRRLTSLPATNLSIRQRGLLKPGFYADVVVFDPATIHDNATF